MKTILSTFLLALTTLRPPLAVQQSQGQDDALASPKLRIEWAEFKKLYESRQIEVVDVRSRDAFKAGHIPGARSIPLDELEKRVGELRTVKRPIVTYCA